MKKADIFHYYLEDTVTHQTEEIAMARSEGIAFRIRGDLIDLYKNAENIKLYERAGRKTVELLNKK